MDCNVAVKIFSFINTKNISYAMKCEKETEGRPTRQKNISNKMYTCIYLRCRIILTFSLFCTIDSITFLNALNCST